ncbi:GyrI-like domain-containing protein [Paenibacillus sp. MMS18-CY102]|uniref:GyrI-like domain-containing protein n=1 Tax=Paenibacillus sp. MMS18-CY102 TaxID=2682849 RepID=UPI001366157D|nr:GyrI-like domain-containing protein [Paenibacillus sp. MMS18-CY102]MWC26702.1 hypothetical protein [Paenibacillus sp. MMS18-CY102]
MILSTHLASQFPFAAVGRTIVFSPRDEQASTNPIAQLWDEIAPRLTELVRPSDKPIARYGICFSAPGARPGDPFDYMAAVSSTALAEVPDDLETRAMPGGQYAVVTYQGPIDGIHSIFDYFHGTWLPSSNYRYAHTRPEFELYDERYTNRTDVNSIFEIWFPVELPA